jgi:tight adherence protein C
MPATELSPLVIVALAFGAVAITVFVIGQFIATQIRVQQRIGAPAQGGSAPEFSSSFQALIATYFDEKRFGVEGSVRAKLRRDLMRAGFFYSEAISYYIFARLATVVVLPTLTYFAVERLMVGHAWYFKLGLVALVTFLAVLGPDAYIARRQRKLRDRYRLDFPDLLDLLVVCVDAGLSLEAALERVSSQIMRQNRAMGTNLLLMGAEMRAGRSLVDALDSLADRLDLNEGHSFVAMLRQSVELGTDIGDALRVFSDEMRDRRLLRAEERANQLPVKMVGPLGLCIFPVILMLVLLPVILRLLTVMR